MTTDPLGSFRDQLVHGVAGEARRRRRRRTLVGGSAAVLALAAGVVVVSAGDSGDQQVTAEAPTEPPFDCPTTRPPEPGLTPPEGWPAQSTDGGVWYGTADLWTSLPADPTDHTIRKSVWWSQNFPGGGDEPVPEIGVTWRRLDDEAVPPVVDDAPGTNAFTPGTGWFMIAGIDPARLGCWEVTASYKGAELSYVYEILPELWAWDEPEDGGEQVIVAGRVRFDEAGNCFLLERDGERFPVVWPYGTTVSDDAQTITLDDDTVIHLGDRVEGGGGYHGADVHALVDIEPSACLVGDPEVAVFQASGPIEVVR